jgi:hypothetical protein
VCQGRNAISSAIIFSIYGRCSNSYMWSIYTYWLKMAYALIWMFLLVFVEPICWVSSTLSCHLWHIVGCMCICAAIQICPMYILLILWRITKQFGTKLINVHLDVWCVAHKTQFHCSMAKVTLGWSANPYLEHNFYMYGWI